MGAADKLTASAVRDALGYDHETGVLTWRVTRGKAKAGSPAGCIGSNGYTVVTVNGIRAQGHRLAWLHHYGEWPKKWLDHINGNPADNRIANLREADPHVNSQNFRRAMSNRSKSGLLGVCTQKGSRFFAARICVRGKSMHLGTYETAQQAHEAYLVAKRRYHEGNTL